MFERIVINRQAFTGEPVDLGFLAECLVFYGKVRVIADVETFRFLVRVCGPDELLDLLETGDLEIEFFDNNTAVQTVETNIGPLHDLITFASDALRYPQVSRKLFDELSGPSGKGATRLFNRFDRTVKRSSYTKEMLLSARTDWLDRTYTTSAVKSLLNLLAPEYVPTEPLIFEVSAVPGAEKIGGSFKVTTNIDFDVANSSYHQRVPKVHSSLSPAYLLIHLADTRRDLSVGLENQSEFALAAARGLMAASKFGEIVSAAPGAKALDFFQEAVVEDLPKIREVVNSGERTFGEVVRLVRRGEKFKDWVKKHALTEDLRSAYCRDVARVDWAERLPSKPVRWLLVNAGATAVSVVTGKHPVLGAVAANALSAVDFFLLDRMLKGWKPNQFIEGPLKEFLHIESASALKERKLIC